MSDWTRDELVSALSSRDPVRLKALSRDLREYVRKGRIWLLRAKPWLWAGNDRTEDDDVQTVLEYLLEKDARVLLKFGQFPGFVQQQGALARYVMGVTRLRLQKECRKRLLAWQLLDDDIAANEQEFGLRRSHGLVERVLDFEKALASLAPHEQDLFDSIYVKQLSQEAICEILALSVPVFQQRKSRLLARLRQFVSP